jgi:NADPH-dependent glutamate synthase beta subunit-like oxidoreductase
MEINFLTSLSDNIRIDREKCTACGRCAEICVLDNLRLQLSPCREACPMGMNCQEYVRLLARGKADQALEKIREATPFGGILGRVCSKPCEAACNRTQVDGQGVAIRDLKRYLTDQDPLPWCSPIAEEKPMKVAIVGAGPAGLSAAFFLRRQGFRIALYDKESAPGGLMRWAIPEFRLPQEVLDRELSFLQTMGIDFHGGYLLGKELELEKLEREFDAILLATGAHGPVRLGVPGENHPGVLPVLEFMKQVRRKKPPTLGSRVVVIGGGNAAVDAAQTAWRLGAQKVQVVSLEKKEEMPAFPWSVAEAEEEGVLFLNGWGPMEFHAEKGRLLLVRLKQCLSVFDPQGNFQPSYDEKHTMDLPADTVILAIGQKGDGSWLAPNMKKDGSPRFDPLTLQTPREKIFLAGDFLRGPKTLVEAMAQGKEAAQSIGRFLLGESLDYGRGNGSPWELHFEMDLTKAQPRPRQSMPQRAVSQRRNFDEVALGFGKGEAQAEAERCLNCGIPVGLRTCWFCLPCEIECPEEALYVEIPYLLR